MARLLLPRQQTTILLALAVAEPAGAEAASTSFVLSP
jgi:hypothetical protein